MGNIILLRNSDKFQVWFKELPDFWKNRGTEKYYARAIVHREK